MNAKEKLVHFLELKSDIIEIATGLIYASEEDIAEIRSWREEMCEKVVKELRRNENKTPNDATLCPWCLEDYLSDFSKNHCEGCEYAMRHGQCDKNSSLYKEITKSKPITDVIGQQIVQLLEILDDTRKGEKK